MTTSRPAHDIGLTVVGDASIDYFVRVPHVAQNDNKAIGSLIGVFPGGMSANLAAAAAVHGGSVELITKTGFDADAAAALDGLNAAGIATSSSVHDRDHRTWMCFVQLDETGEKALIGADTGIKLPRTDELDVTLLHRSRIVAPLADDLAWATEVAQHATAGGAQVAIDLEPDAFDPGDPALRALLERTEVVFMNAASAEKLQADDEVAAADRIHRMGPPLVVVSSGGKGAYCSRLAGPAYRAHASGAPTAIDTTGAGDALAGAFLGAFLQGLDLRECLERGVAQATACVTEVGSRTYLAEAKQPLDGDHFIKQFPVESERCQ